MKTWIGLLRGVNVSGKNRIPMADLRAALHADGLVAVETYIQSGNLVFRSDDDEARLAERISTVIHERLGLRVETVVIAPSRLARIVDDTPFPLAGSENEKRAYFTFLFDRPEGDAAERLDPSAYAPDEVVVARDVAYVRVMNGYGRTRLTNNYLERRLGVAASTRNLRTVRTLLAMAGASASPST